MSDAPTVSALLFKAISETVGATAAPVSFSVEFGVLGAGEAQASARIERATRSLVFAAGEARYPDGRIAATASGVWRVAGS